MSAADFDLKSRVARLERNYRVALLIATLSTAVAALAVAGTVSGGANAAAAAASRPKVIDSLRVREINVVDGNGITRVKIAAPLPHATINGQQLKSRGGRPEDTISGILLFDAEGVERSGYATVDHGYSNVLLTLDDKEKQHALFIAEPTGATTLRLFNGETKDRVDVAITKDGPSISMTRGGEEIYRLPPK